MASMNISNKVDYGQNSEFGFRLNFLTPEHILGSSLIFLCTMLCNSAGIGGGPITLSILIYLFSKSSPEALALSQISIFGGSIIATAIKTRFKHPSKSNWPLIDYKLCGLMAPLVMLGSSYGSLLTKLFPTWFLLLCLSFLVWTICVITLYKGLRMYKTESRLINGYQKVAVDTIKDKSKPKGMNQGIFMLILSILFLILYSFTKSVIFYYQIIENCLHAYLFILLIYHVFTFIQIIWYSRFLVTEENLKIYSSTRNVLKLSLLAYATGVIAGTLGIGGGLVLNPVLLMLGLDVEVTTACCNLMVFASSISSSLQFVIMGQIGLFEGCLLFVLSVLGSCVGIFFFKQKVEKYNRISILVFVLSAVLAVVGVLIPVQLVQKVSELVKEGNFGFTLNQVC